MDHFLAWFAHRPLAIAGLALVYVVLWHRFRSHGPALFRTSRPTGNYPVPAALIVLLGVGLTPAAAEPAPEERVAGNPTEYRSPAGVVERCVALERIPGGEYSAEDLAVERRYCEIDFSSPTVALCPKTWSTSPATVVYQVTAGSYAKDAARFEREQCPRGGHARAAATSELAFFKTSMNARDTSGTFSMASLTYYHLSRFLQTRVRVPVAVYRSMDRSAHRTRVSEPGLRDTAGKTSLRMIHAGWQHMVDAESDPKSLASFDELFTPDGDRIFGVLLLETGDRYGAEINGTRASGWGDGQNHDFQHTAPYLALRQDLPLRQAIEAGLHEARRDPAMARALRQAPSEVQMTFWMQEVLEIALLDYLLRQQDRIGNIDYEERWHWVDDGKVADVPATSKNAPENLAGRNPVLLRRTWLNDNDAGVRRSYSNFAKRTGMLVGLRRFNAGLYRRLQQLAADLAAQGEIYRYLSDVVGLSDHQRSGIAERASEAATQMRKACEAGELRFDLEPEELLATGSVIPRAVACDGSPPPA